MKARSRHFILSGGVGGLIGFAIMELCSLLLESGGSRANDILSMAIYFSGFGLAVGAALGMTEGFVRKNRAQLRYGLIIGLILGAAGGFAGGGAGQIIFGLVPIRYARPANVDLAVALDSSGSMRMAVFFGSDPWGRRKKATRSLVDRLSSSERVAIIDFDDQSRLLCPLTRLDTPKSRRAVKEAIDTVDSSGGTNLNAGLNAAINELIQSRKAGREQHIIFLTDGMGEYSPVTAVLAQQSGVRVHTIGLGADVDAVLLTEIAHQTGGKYYPVAKASELVVAFEKVLTEGIVMTELSSGKPADDAEMLTSPILLIIVRILSWGAMGLAIGFGQGIRENTREDLRACSIGGLLGGLIGGALFDPVSAQVTLGSGLVGRGLADVVVGACIGGSMKLAQQVIVETSVKPTTTLLSILPEKDASMARAPDEKRIQHPTEGSESSDSVTPFSVQTSMTGSRPQPKPDPVAPARREPLDSIEECYPDRSLAMALAHRDGYSLSEIARYFGVSIGTVRRAVSQHASRGPDYTGSNSS